MALGLLVQLPPQDAYEEFFKGDYEAMKEKHDQAAEKDEKDIGMAALMFAQPADLISQFRTKTSTSFQFLEFSSRRRPIRHSVHRLMAD